MDPRTQERVERWDSRPFAGGYDGLSDLADRGFSGAVTTGGTWLFMLNGRVVGIVDGSMATFEDASGTTYVAPDPALPLLSSMLETGGETKAKYYTNETPLTEVDRTLTEKSFTGYVELSEGVLSGDYYVVYYGGRRMAAAYIGNAERLLTDEEAFQRAADEVGIYEVTEVTVEVTDVPGAAGTVTAPPAEEPAEPDTSDEPDTDAIALGSGDGPADDTAGDAASSPTPESSDTSTLIADVDVDPEPAGITTEDTYEHEPATAGITDGITDPVVDEAESDDEGAGTDTDGETADGDGGPTAETETADGTATEVADRTASEETTSQVTTPAPEPDDLEQAVDELDGSGLPWDDEAADATDDADSPPQAEASTPTEDSLEERFEEEARWRETRRIPSIDPENSSPEASSGGQAESRPSAGPDGRHTRSQQPFSPRQRSPASAESTASGAPERQAPTDAVGDEDHAQADTEPTDGSDDALEFDMFEREDKIDQLTQRVDDLQSQRDDLERERAALASTNRDLTETIEQLERRIADLETRLEAASSPGQEAVATPASDAGTGGQQLSPRQALSGTNLFVRYGSKSQPTLETAHAGEADATAVDSNLLLEHHTQFSAADATVDGQPYEAFLTDTIEYQFVDWLTRTLLYEVRDTGHANALADLYDVIPRIDRAELGAAISLADDDTEDVPDAVTFDVVAFDKRGTPLLVANFNDSREPATREMLIDLEETASAVNANYPDLGAAMVVTASFFDPGALEVAEEATGGGFLSRGSKLSYVNLSRKQGYHLCLVEARGGGFHVTVPEL